jgi:AcrR family transcriptional regulator
MGEQRRAEIMGAVYAALCDRGYADLTMQDIADQCSLSKGALHYHFDTKRDLLLAFLSHLYGRFTDRLSAAEAAAGDDPADRLLALVDASLSPPEREGVREFRTAVLEIKAQAPYEPAYRERLADFDAYVHDRVESIVAEGIERERFSESIDPADAASFVVTAITGAHTRCAATGEPVGATRRALAEYLAGLSADEGTDADAGTVGTTAGDAGAGDGTEEEALTR